MEMLVLIACAFLVGLVARDVGVAVLRWLATPISEGDRVWTPSLVQMPPNGIAPVLFRFRWGRHRAYSRCHMVTWRPYAKFGHRWSLLWSLLLALVLAAPDAHALARHAVTAVAKASGSRNLVVLPSASIRVYKPGATASSTSSGLTVTVYSSATIQVGDTVEVNGNQAEVLTVPNSTSFTIDTALVWSKGDRFLRASQPITIYRDAGGTESITQPATADTSGRLTFFYDASVTPTFDLKAYSSDGLRMVDHSITNPGEGTSAGGWTDNGTTVTTSTNTDTVGIGGAPASAKLEVVANDSQLASVTTPVCGFRLEGDTSTSDWCLFMDSGEELTWFSYDDSRAVTRLYDGAHNRMALGDIANVDVTNPGTFTIRARLATHRGLVISGASSQSANLLELRDSTEAVKMSCTVAGTCTVSTTLAAGEDVTAVDDVTAGDDIVATDRLTGAALTVSGTSVSLRGLTYTLPSAHVAGRLTNDGAGVLTWVASAAYCDAKSIKVLPTTGSTTEFFSLNSFETSTPNYAQSEAAELDARSWTAPATVTASNFRVQTAGTMSSGSVVYTLMNTGVATALTCTINSSNSTCTSVGTATITAGDRLSVRGVASSAVAGTVVWLSIAFCLGG